MQWKCVDVRPFRDDRYPRYGMQRVRFKSDERDGQIIMEVAIIPEHDFQVGQYYSFPRIDSRLVDKIDPDSV